ncbi:MAG: hypothetical protein ACTSR8_07970 [Promethearchaeota archaeon]
MNGIWDKKADMVQEGDKKRDVTANTIFQDENGFTHYKFDKILFKNPWYDIPDDDFQLFESFINGGSRAYPSDGSIPCDIVAREARKILNKISACAADPNHPHYQAACDSLKNGKNALVRGTLKIYLDKLTTRDWRRKRFTDDIDFWCFNVNLLEHALKNLGWVKNKDGEWEKKVRWTDPDTKKTRYQILFAANNLNQLLDFGAGSYLEGSDMKEVFAKKIKRGHEVDLSDIINIAIVKGGRSRERWDNVWVAFEEAANTRNTRSTSNLISLARYSFAIADHLERVGRVIKKYNDLIFDKSKYSDEDIYRFCRNSIHWEEYYHDNGPDKTREMLHDFYHEQAEEKPIHAKNLREFANNLIELLNFKYKFRKVIFEIEN